MKIRLLLFALLLSNALPAQVEILSIRKACAFDDTETPNKDYYTFPGSDEAKNILKEILRANVLEPNFTLRSGDCKNALATSLGGQRYIVYSTTFLENFKRDARTKWAAYCVLAHEVGHHLNNDNLNETSSSQRRLYEIKADQFAGGALYRLGASLEEAQAGIHTFSLEGGTDTHPPKSARLEAVASGWKRAQETDRGRVVEKTPVTATKNSSQDADAKAWYNKGVDETDNNKKIEYYTKAISLKPDFAFAYNNRGSAKDDLGQYKEAIKDYDRAIQLNPNYAKAYNNRGIAKNSLGQYTEAIKDYDRTIQLDSNDPDYYYNRGIAKDDLGQYKEAIKDYDWAIQLDTNHAKAYCGKGCALVKLEKYYDAIEALNKGLRLDGSLGYAKDCLKEATSKL